MKFFKICIFSIFACLLGTISAQLTNIGNCDRPCENGGNCLRLGLTMAYCICLTGFTGPYCQTGVAVPTTPPVVTTTVRPVLTNSSGPVNIRTCNSTTCRNGGRCLVLGLEMAYCLCVNGFEGSTCEISSPNITAPTTPGVQTNNNITTAPINTNITTAPINTNITTAPINTNITIAPQPPQFRECDEGVAVCRNNGTCRVNNADEISCNCPAPFLPPFCTNRTAFCTVGRCLNGGTCVPNGDDGECKCAEGFSGQTCNIAPCNPNPCKNGAECLNIGGEISCFCLPPLRRPFCE